METYGLQDAAKLARCHPDTLRKLACAGVVPATKVGRPWLFPAQLFNEWIENRCRSITVPGAPTGTSGLAARLVARLAQRTARKPRSSSESLPTGCGDSADSEIVAPSRGARLQSAGSRTHPGPAAATGKSSAG